MRRVAVVGTSGSGKTTLARELAARLGVPHVELDAVQHLPGWEPCPPDRFRERVGELLRGGSWVVDGNYTSRLGHRVIDDAELVVWLDLPRWMVTQRVVRRTLRRVITREELWNGNREPWTNLYARDPERNVILWSWATHTVNRGRYDALADERWVRLRSPAEVRRWLRGFSPAAGSS